MYDYVNYVKFATFYVVSYLLHVIFFFQFIVYVFLFFVFYLQLNYIKKNCFIWNIFMLCLFA